MLVSPDVQATNGSEGANSSKVLANEVMQSLYHDEQRLRLLAFETHSSSVSMWGKAASIVLALALFPVFSDLSLAADLNNDSSLSLQNLSLCTAQLWVSEQASNFMKILPQFGEKKKPNTSFLWAMLYYQNCTAEYLSCSVCPEDKERWKSMPVHYVFCHFIFQKEVEVLKTSRSEEHMDLLLMGFVYLSFPRYLENTQGWSA